MQYIGRITCKSFAHGQYDAQDPRLPVLFLLVQELPRSDYVDFYALASLMHSARPASGFKVVLFRFSCSYPLTCDITLCAVCPVSLGICASLMQAVLRTDFPSIKERSINASLCLVLASHGYSGWFDL